MAMVTESALSGHKENGDEKERLFHTNADLN
jgi:hypothetical protein